MIERVYLVEPPAPDPHVFSFCNLPRLGLPLLGAILKAKGYKVTILTPASGRLDPRELARADLLGISLTTSTAAAGYRLADLVRDLAAAAGRRIPVVFGGVHATFLPEEALHHGDYVVRHEGEETLPELLAALDTGGDLSAITGLSYRKEGRICHNPDRPRQADLDSLPLPDLSLIRNFKPTISPILASRGCPHNCTFCCVTAMMGRNYRFAGVRRVLEELRRVPTRNVFFYDDNFAADRGRTKALLRGMIEEGLNLEWSAQVRSDVAEDEELVTLMRRAGGSMLYIGLESVNQDALVEFHKGLTVASVERNIRTLKRHGFQIHGMFIFGADHDRPEVIKRTVAFSKRMGLDTVQFMILTPLPGTELYARLAREGRLLTTDWRRYDGANVVYRPAGMTAYELQRLTHWALRRFYSWRLLLRYAWTRQWAKAGLVVYARHVLQRWRARHRRDLRLLKLTGNTN
ncbi:MAG: B12-binding domain-containing radical SAM protein [Patescibacteria group bacterium]